MVVNDNAGWQVPRRRSRVFREQARSYRVCVRKQREEYLETVITRGNTSISRVSYIQHLTFFIEWYNVVLRGTYHIIKTREISWHAAV